MRKKYNKQIKLFESEMWGTRSVPKIEVNFPSQAWTFGTGSGTPFFPLLGLQLKPSKQAWFWLLPFPDHDLNPEFFFFFVSVSDEAFTVVVFVCCFSVRDSDEAFTLMVLSRLLLSGYSSPFHRSLIEPEPKIASGFSQSCGFVHLNWKFQAVSTPRLAALALVNAHWNTLPWLCVAFCVGTTNQCKITNANIFQRALEFSCVVLGMIHQVKADPETKCKTPNWSENGRRGLV